MVTPPATQYQWNVAWSFWPRRMANSSVGTMGTGGGAVHCTPQVKYAAYIKIFSKPLTTRWYEAATNLYPPLTYENVPTRLMANMVICHVIVSEVGITVY